MPVDDWGDQFQDLWNSTPGTDALEANEQSYVEALFDAGFTHHAEEYESQGLDPEQVHAIRQEFFDYMGLDEDQFDWQEWREAMGYE